MAKTYRILDDQGRDIGIRIEHDDGGVEEFMRLIVDEIFPEEPRQEPRPTEHRQYELDPQSRVRG